YSFVSGPGAGPGSSLAVLSGPDPTAGGLFSYTAAGVTLAPATDYCIVLTSATPVTTGAYQGRLGGSAITASQGWDIPSFYQTSVDGSNWSVQRSGALQLAVFATAVPEPSAGLLALVGIAAVGLMRTSGARQQR